jgi:hypothetical protein
MVPTPTPVIAYDLDPGSSVPQITYVILEKSSSAPDTHMLNLPVMLEKAINSLPHISEASDSNQLVVFAQGIPTELDKEDAWKFLNPLLNHFLGSDRSLESISNALCGGERGLAGIVQYL